MKTRQGFVSNSSSSSFIILGVRGEDVKLPEGMDVYEVAEFMGENYPNLKCHWTSQYGHIFGRKLVSTCDGYIGDGEYSMDELHKMANDIITDLNYACPDNETYPVKLYHGTTC